MTSPSPAHDSQLLEVENVPDNDSDGTGVFVEEDVRPAGAQTFPDAELSVAASEGRKTGANSKDDIEMAQLAGSTGQLDGSAEKGGAGNGADTTSEAKDAEALSVTADGPGPAPDGGYGWVVVVACFFTQACGFRMIQNRAGSRALLKLAFSHTMAARIVFVLEIDMETINLLEYVPFCSSEFISWTPLRPKVTFGYQTSFGPFQRYFVANQTFGPSTSNVQVAFISSIMSAITFIVGPLSGLIIEKIGYRATAITGSSMLCAGMIIASFAKEIWQVYLSYSLIGGVGIALAYIPSTSILPQWFSKKMGLAMGIAISGGGIGGLFLAPVMQAILDTLGWQWAWRIGGLIAGIGGGGAGFLIKARLPIPKRKAGIMAQFDFYRFKDFTFVRLYFSIMFVSLSFFVPYSYIPLFASSIGITPSTSSIVIGVMNAMNALGRIVMGFVSDHFGHLNTWLLNIWICSLTVLLIWTNTNSLGLLFFFAICFGFTGGAFTSLYPVTASKIWGAAGAAALMGMLFTALIPGGLLGAVIGGAMIDSTATIGPDGEKEYHFLGVQLYCGFMLVVSASILLWVRLERGNTIGQEGVIKGLKLRM